MKHLILILALGSSLLIRAQVHIDLDSDRTPHSQWLVNPANSSNEKVYLFLPALGGYNLGLGHTGFSLDQVTDGNQLQVGNLINELDKENHFLASSTVNLFGLGFKIRELQLRAGVTQTFSSRMTYTRDFLEMIWLGNGHPDVIGKRVSLDQTGVNALGYFKVYAGGSLELIQEKLTFGANLNYYKGAATVQTLESQFGLTTTSTDYTITADGNLDIAIAGIADLDSLDNVDLFNDLVFNNSGFGADLGLIFKPSPRHEVKASVMNLGKIDWQNNVSNYRIKDSEISFSGFDLNDIIGSNDSSEVIQQFVDSLTEVFTPDEFQEGFKTNLNPEMAFSLSYMPSDKNKFTVLVRSQNNFGTRINHSGIIYARRLGKILELSGGAMLFNNKDLIVPFSLVLDAGPVQLGLQTSNVAAAFSLDKTKYLSASMSLGFRFGKNKEKAVKKVKE